jgi:hypothetical protein
MVGTNTPFTFSRAAALGSHTIHPKRNALNAALGGEWKENDDLLRIPGQRDNSPPSSPEHGVSYYYAVFSKLDAFVVKGKLTKLGIQSFGEYPLNDEKIKITLKPSQVDLVLHHPLVLAARHGKDPSARGL